jgi:hypothetical protein
MDKGLFSDYAPPGTRPRRPNPEGAGILASIPPELRDAAVAELKRQGVPVTAVNIAEMAATLGRSPAAARAPAPASVAAPKIGAQPSEDLLGRVKAAQDARNAEVLRKALEERRRLSGAR